MTRITKDMLIVALGQCECCASPEPATEVVHRVWHDGVVDPEMKVCKHHSMSDQGEPQMWRMFNSLTAAYAASALIRGGQR